jgi:PEP-CTERM motif
MTKNMRKKNLFCRTAALALICALTSVGVAHATPLNTIASLTIWNFTNAGGLITDANQQALPSNPGAVLANQVYSGTYTGPINFTDPSGGINTIAAFLNSAGGTFLPLQNLTQTLSTAPFAITTLMDFEFTIPTEDIGTISHDDGMSVWNATNTTNFIDSSFPTADISTPFDLAAGTYNVWYAESNGLPADLIIDVTRSVGVPEPGTLALFGLGLVGLGFVRRRRTA